MQLVEQGKIDLDADINRYLDFRIEPRSDTPITMRHLMTHTPGFEESLKGLIVQNDSQASAEKEAKRWVPQRVFEPGTTPAYSNYGANLAGYIVERVSGERFEAYAQKHILGPLGMTSSTFVQPLPPALAPRMSRGYAPGSSEPQPFEFVAMPPAGSATASVTDIAKFMLAHLQQGRLGAAQILRPETAALMHDTRLRLMEPLNGIALGFYEQNINGHRVIGHGGDTQLFHSELLLFLDDGVGLFVVQNSTSVPARASIRTTVFEHFADRYLPAARGTPVAHVEERVAREHAQQIAGRYVSARGSFSSFVALGGLLGQFQVVPNADGTVSLPILTDGAGRPKRYRETVPFLWEEVGGHDRLHVTVRDGRPMRMSLDFASGIMVFERAPGYLSAAWLVPAVSGALLVLALTVVAWPIGAWQRRHYGAPFPVQGVRARALRAVRVAALLTVAVAIGWLVLLSLFGSPSGLATVARLDGVVLALVALTCVVLLGGIAAGAYQVYAATSTPAGFWARTRAVLVFVAFGLVGYFAVLGNLVKFTTNY
jgi:hypothetical protein